ncbi:MAG: T9SS type A sorting domain-containing protein [Bacteroidota bacterium]|nr:T9SS type A sorting domain-containing protein [Bacteroidota bacterium]
MGSVQIKVGTGNWQTISPQYYRYSGCWTYTSIDLTSYADSVVKIGFLFTSTNCNELAGWYIDDIALITGPVVFNTFENWESGMGDWYAESGTWRVGMATGECSGGPSGPNRLWTACPGTTNSRFISPFFNVSSASTNPNLRFWHCYSFGGGTAYVQIRTKTGTWQNLLSYTQSGGGVWSRPYADLTPYADSTVQIAFLYTGGSWYIDDILITGMIPPTPNPVSPPNNSICAPLNPLLKWSASAGATLYYLQVDTANTFPNPIFSDSTLTQTTHVVGPLEPLKSYYWRVRAKNDFGRGEWSNIWKFTTVSNPPLVPLLLSPNNNAVEQPTSLTFKWNVSCGVSTYHIQIDTSQLFNTTIINDSLLTDTSKLVSTFSVGTKYYWRVRAKNEFGSSDWSIVWNFTTIIGPPPTPLLMSPDSGATNQPTTITLRWHPASGASKYLLQVDTSISFGSSVLKSDSTTGSSYIISSLDTSKKYYWRVRSKNNYGVSDWSSAWNFTTGSSTVTCSVSIASGWNLISVPVTLDNYKKENVFPSATSNAFKYNAGYIVADTLKNGVGYWLKFPKDTSIELYGGRIDVDTIEVTIGWNMIGSISSPVNVNSITSPSPIIASPFYGYKNGYIVADSIKPGKGYWVKVNQGGKLILSTTSPIYSASRIKIVDDGELPPSAPDQLKEDICVSPTEFKLNQNFPNPFNPSTVISYSIPTREFVSLIVYNTLGQEVAVLVNEIQDAGYKSVKFNMLSYTGLSSGLYFYRLTAGTYISIKKIIFVK